MTSFAAVVAMALAVATLPAQGDEKFAVTASFRPANANAGDKVELVLQAKVAVGFHAYGTLESTNVPVALRPESLQAGPLERVGDAKVPPGHKESAFGIDTYPLPSSFEVTQQLRVPAGTPNGDIEVSGELDYQICDANMCLPPATMPFKVVLHIGAGDPPVANGSKPAPGIAAPGVAAPGASGQGAGAQGARARAPQEPLKIPAGKLIALRASVTPSPAHPDETVDLVLEVLVDQRYHAYGTLEATNLPVDLPKAKLQAGSLELVGEPVIPPGEATTLLGVEAHPLPHEFRVSQRLHVPSSATPGSVTIRGEFGYQLCDDNQCLRPESQPFEVTLPIEAGAARAPAPPEALPQGDDPVGGSLLGLLLACVLGGLFALVMPCTYPMIPITFSFFTKQADARGGKVLTLALAYGAGIVVMFASIGALAGVVGGYIVPFAAHWITNLVIGTFFVIFGLSLLGVFTLSPPAFLVNAAGKTRGAGGLVGVLLMGATLVITSFTCTAPVVALLLVPAVQSGDSFRPTLGMAVFGLTMALPFVLLALLPGRVRSLPRSGEWMNTLKVSLGFVELAAALKFFSNAEYVEELHILPREVFFAIWIAIFTALAVYLLGLIPRHRVSLGRGIGGVASVLFAGYCLYGALGYPLDFVMTALAPAYGARDVSHHELYVDDYDAAAARAKAEGKLVLVNFTGFTCTNCRMVERGILPAEAIAPILAKNFVEARLHMDNESVIPAAKWKRHVQLRQDLVAGRVTTPTYVTVDPNGDKELVEHVLQGGPSAWEKGYLEFLQQSLRKAGRAPVETGAVDPK